MSVEPIIAELRRALSSLAPPGCAYEVAAVGGYLTALRESELNLVGAWAPHRQQEFAAGRSCARHALLQLDVAAGDLLPNIDGIPRWPEGVLGCISHSRGIAMAVAARGGVSVVLGLDLEKTNRLSKSAMKKVVHPLEADFVASDQVRASILFSLKEAFYKAQFPRWRTPGNFHDLALEVDLEAGVAEVLELDVRFAAELERLNFSFRLVDDYVLSLCWM